MSSLKVGVFIDPVGNPDLTAPQLAWAELIERALERLPGACVYVISSFDVCQRWLISTPPSRPPRRHHPISLRSLLEPFAFSIQRYQLAAFEPPDDRVPASPYRDMAEQLDLDLLVMCTHNQMLDRATPELRKLYIEQAPLPRLGHPRRLILDAVGHRVGSMLERHAADILSLSLDERDIEVGKWILHDLQVHLTSDQRYGRVKEFADRIRGNGKRLAVLACQPSAGVPCVDGYDSSDVCGLVARWASELSDGWDVICTYHLGEQFRPGNEALLKNSFPNLHFLDRELAVDSTELLVLNTDALVTVSSSTALTAVLFGKPAATVGQSPFSAWTGSRVSELARLKPWPEIDRLRLLQFLCGSYCLPEANFGDGDQVLLLLKEIMAGNWEQQCLNPHPFQTERVRSIFNGLYDRTDAIEHHVRRLKAAAIQAEAL